jgi:hypothetical protein
MNSPGDCYGAHEVVSALAVNPDIVRRHLRLWLSSTAVLQSLLNRDLLTRASALIDEVRDTLQTYVPNQSINEARRILDDKNVCIIAGIPGIGKTTLAHVLVAEYLTSNYDIVEIFDIEEIDRAWDDTIEQLFYFDDFLGETILAGRAKRNEGLLLIRLFGRISKAANKKIVLTTREYILAQARQNSERLAQEDFSPVTCTLDLESFTTLIRAEILYNHIFHSNLPAPNKAVFADPAIYNPVIHHGNFSPRLIALSLDVDHGMNESPSDTAGRLMINLDNPARIWRHIVESQIEEAEIDVLVVLLTMPAVTALDDLLKAWTAYRGTGSDPNGDRSLRRALKILDGTMTRAEQIRYQNIPAVTYHNPSVRDFMLSYVMDQPNVVRALLDRAIFFEQVDGLWSIATSSGSAWLLDIVESRIPILELAILRVLDSRLSITRYVYEEDPVARAIVCIQIAEKYGLEDLARAVIGYLTRQSLRSAANDGEDLVRLLHLVASSTFSFVKERLDQFVTEAVEWITEDTSDMPNIQYALDLIGRMGDLAPPHVADGLATDLEERVTREFELYSTQEHLTYSSDFEELLAHAATVDNPQEYYPGYERVSYLAKQAKEDKVSNVPAAPEVQSPDIENDSEVIHHMMSLLRQDLG